MPTPSNLPSSSIRETLREGAASRFQSVGLLVRSHRITLPLPPPAFRSVPQSFLCLTVEPEDAKITGATRSLSRRLLALNMHQES